MLHRSVFFVKRPAAGRFGTNRKPFGTYGEQGFEEFKYLCDVNSKVEDTNLINKIFK
jgi:hypothetical protein